MKSYKYYKIKAKKFLFTVFFASILFSCTELDTPIESELSSDNFPKTEEDFVYASGKVYTNLANQYFKAYWFLQEFSADGLLITANGGHWYDGGRYKNLHMHTWTPDHRFVRQVWQSFFSGVNICNSLLTLFEEAPESEFKTTAVAEIKTMRAFYYFMLIDLYGDVPLVKNFGDEVPTRTNRGEVFNYVEQELISVLPYLRTETGAATYGRPTKWMAYALLSKLYINAEVYTGTDMYDEAIAMCDAIIEEANDNGTFALDADYLNMFSIDNGPSIKDFIYAIPYDSYNISEQQYFCRYLLHPAHSEKYSLPYNPSGCARAVPEYYDLFDDPNDQRNGQWLTGKQYLWDGTPIAWETTNIGLDNSYNGSEPDAAVTYHLELTREIVFDDFDNFDTGDDALGRAIGFRTAKFYPDTLSLNRNQSNDWPVFRYADVLLIKAEAILRGGEQTLGQSPLDLVNMVRTRSDASLFLQIDIDGLLDERARELSFECWRRNDLIRFGKFETEWGFKTDTDVRKRLFPVPTTEMDLNPEYEQNQGY